MPSSTICRAALVAFALAIYAEHATEAALPLPPQLPPWFSASPWLPDVMRFNNGSAVRTLSQWQARRVELRELLEAWIVGSPPVDEPPPLISAAVINETVGSGARSQYASLAFLANGTTISFTVWLSCPQHWDPSQRLRGTMLTQWNHRQWAQRAVGRGLCTVVYPGADDRDASGRFADAYGRSPAVWGKIARRAWLASRVIDALPSLAHTLPGMGGQPQHGIYITGHSRNGKQSILAAAFDERISAVVGSSPGAPIASPWRFSSREYMGEGPEYVSDERGWWLPFARKFQGREHQLPADGHFALALVAGSGRRLLLGTARHDFEGDISFANEQALQAVAPAFALAGGSACIQYREGCHHGFIDVDAYIDFFLGGYDSCSAATHAFSWQDDWNSTIAGAAARDSLLPPLSANLSTRVGWVLGPPPPEGFSFGTSFGEQTNPLFTYTALMMHEARGDPSQPDITHNSSVTRLPVSIGAYRQANLYFPTTVARGASSDATTVPLPVVILLHPFSYHTGYVTAYTKQDPSANSTTDLFFWEFARRGYLVLALDLSGFGMRVTESPRLFYSRHPESSRLASMVSDVRAALDLLGCLAPSTRGGRDPRCISGEAPGGAYPDRLTAVPSVDINAVHVVGYSMGGLVALHAAALDSRITGSIATFSGFTPFRTDTGNAASRTGGTRRWWELHALAPRLGLFQGREADIPYDFDELMLAIAPRPTLVWAPLHDRFSTLSDIVACVRKVNSTSLTLRTPDTDSRFGNVELEAYAQFLHQVDTSL